MWSTHPPLLITGTTNWEQHYWNEQQQHRAATVTTGSAKGTDEWSKKWWDQGAEVHRSSGFLVSSLNSCQELLNQKSQLSHRLRCLFFIISYKYSLLVLEEVRRFFTGVKISNLQCTIKSRSTAEINIQYLSYLTNLGLLLVCWQSQNWLKNPSWIKDKTYGYCKTKKYIVSYTSLHM